MEISNETIIGFLTGTVATVVLKGVVDYFQKKVEFKRDIQKSFHGKKLEAAEHVIKAMFQSYQSTIIIICAIENLLNSDLDGELFDNIWVSYFKHIEHAENNLLMSSATLYFNLENDELWNSNDQKLLFDTYSQIKVIGEKIQIYEVELSKMKQGKGYEDLENYIDDELIKLLKVQLKNLMDLLQKSSKAIFQTIENIKSEFRK